LVCVCVPPNPHPIPVDDAATIKYLVSASGKVSTIGDQLASLTVGNVFECAVKCTAHPLCQSYTFVTSNCVLVSVPYAKASSTSISAGAEWFDRQE
jgi:hypothetical protein